MPFSFKNTQKNLQKTFFSFFPKVAKGEKLFLNCFLYNFFSSLHVFFFVFKYKSEIWGVRGW